MKTKRARTKTESWAPPPGTPISFEAVAEAMRFSTAALSTEVFDNIKGCDIEPAEAMTAIATGALGYGVNAYFRFWIALGMSADEVRAQMDAVIGDIWRQSAEAHVKALAARVN